MKKGILKKSVAVMMTAAMILSVTGCGGKDGDKKKKSEETQDTKEMTFQGEDFPMEGYQGDISSIYVRNGKLYFNTYEWVEGESGSEDLAGEGTDEENTDGEEDTAGEDEQDQEDTSEENVENEEDTTEEDEKDQEDTSEEKTEDSEETTKEEEDTSEENAENQDDASNEDTEDGEESQEEEYEYVDGTSVTRLYSADIDGSNVTEIPMPELRENEWMNAFAIDDSGNITLFLNSYDEKAESSTYFLVKIDEQGNELSRTDVTKELKMTQDDYVSKMLMDGKGRYIVTMDQRVCILDENGKSMGELKSDNYLEGAALTKDGTVVCGSSVYSESEQYAQVQVLDVDGKKWGDSYKLDVGYFSSSDSLMNGIDYDFYYKDDSGIYGYDMAGKKSEKIMDYVASYITSDESWGITPIAKDKMLGTSYDNGKTKCILYSKVDPSSIVDKTTITYGAMWIDDSIKRAAIAFNKESKEYEIEFKDYSNEEDPITKMNADIVAGNVADIMDLSNIPVEQYVAKGLLEDLTPYYEKDSEISTDDILDSVLEAMKIDGKLYYVTSSFSISTLVASADDVGDAAGWTFDDLKALLDTKGNDVKLFWSDNKTDMMSSFLQNGLSDFVDWQTGECSFNSQDFKDILEICNNRGMDEEYEWDEDAPSEPTMIMQGKMLFEQGWVSPEQIEVDDKIFDGKAVYIGYPNKEKDGSYFNFSGRVGIYSKSEVKDGAWEFLRTLMTKEYQGSTQYMYNTPTRKDCFDMYMERMTATKEYTDELGQEISPMNSGWGWGDFDVEIGPLTEEQAEVYRNLVNNTKRLSSYDDAMMEIIRDEVKAYFAGEKSLDETADIIQNRIKTYVNENR